jgi:hypothetical protein
MPYPKLDITIAVGIDGLLVGACMALVPYVSYVCARVM